MTNQEFVSYLNLKAKPVPGKDDDFCYSYHGPVRSRFRGTQRSALEHLRQIALHDDRKIPAVYEMYCGNKAWCINFAHIVPTGVLTSAVVDLSGIEDRDPRYNGMDLLSDYEGEDPLDEPSGFGIVHPVGSASYSLRQTQVEFDHLDAAETYKDATKRQQALIREADAILSKNGYRLLDGAQKRRKGGQQNAPQAYPL